MSRRGRSVNEVTEELGRDWHTINDDDVAYGQALADHPGRFGKVDALELDETAFVRAAPYHRTEFITSIIDVARGRLLDVVPGRGGPAPRQWLMNQSSQWRERVAYSTLDLSGAYKAVLDACLPKSTQVADPLHVIKLTNERVGECRRRIQNEVLEHRGRQADPPPRPTPTHHGRRAPGREGTGEDERSAARRRPLRAGRGRLGGEGSRPRALRTPGSGAGDSRSPRGTLVTSATVPPRQ